LTAAPSTETKLDLALKTGPYGIWGGRKFKKDGLSLKRLKENPAGVNISALQPVFPDRLFTKNKTINAAPDLFVREFEHIKALLSPPANGDYPLKLIGRRHLRSNNSWMHNLPLLEGGSRTCTALLHPEDAEAFNVQDQEKIEVYSPHGSIQLHAEVSPDIIRGTVSIPHGWGHNGNNTQMDVANKTDGANVNVLMDHSRLCSLSYNMAFSGQPVGIRKVG
jgi:anaerobic selenocysteine-containing dehydrogenase